jgi:sodium/bile acid cotransporter 7
VLLPSKAPALRVQQQVALRGGQQWLKATAMSSSSDNLAEASGSSWSDRIARVKEYANKNFFLVGMFVAVALARLAPALGRNGGILRPELFIGRYGVTFIFLLSGLSLELSQLSKAASNVNLNFLIQLATFGAWPFLVGVPLKYVIGNHFPLLIPSALVDGLLILTCLPTTVNMCVILSSAAGGNTASALWNAIMSNLGGIFFTPALLFRFFGTNIHLPFLEMLIKLCNKVLVPVAIGQALRATPAKSFYSKHSRRFKRLQELVLLSILWNAFCTAISKGLGLNLRHGLALATVLPALHIASLAILFKFFSLPAFNFSRRDVVSGMFCASQKTLAFGLPLIQTIFEGNPNLAMYCAPLMFIHPLQLTIGSLLVPRLEQYTSKDKE